jgi:DNA modification methylase
MIILGDCYEEILKVDDNSVSLIIIDPPYNISKSSNFKKHSLTTPDELHVCAQRAGAFSYGGARRAAWWSWGIRRSWP